MVEWICIQCGRVVTAKEFSCCGPVERFDPAKHGCLIVGKSNAWIQVWGKWKDRPLLQSVSQKLAGEGCFSAAAVLNEFIEELAGKITRSYD